MKYSRLLEPILLSIASYKIGELIGKAIHTYIIYILPLGYMTQQQYERYIVMYNKYNNNLESLLELAFGLTSTALTLSAYIYLRYLHEYKY